MVKRATKRKRQPNRAKSDTTITLPQKFVPHFWSDQDRRLAHVREIQKRYEDLVADSAANSVQKELLCQRAVFLSIWIETQKVNAASTGEFDAGKYVHAVNSLVGLLRCLGLDKQAKETMNLSDYATNKSHKSARKARKREGIA